MRTLAPDLKGVCTTCSYETEWFGEFEDFNAQLGVCPKCGHQLELFDNLQPEPEWLEPYREFEKAPLPRVTHVQFVNRGTVHADNCCRICRDPVTGNRLPLGVGADGRAHNRMEMRFTLSGHQPGTWYDIIRTRRNSLWQRHNGVWQRLESQPMGTFDDRHNQDECLQPRGGQIFVIDHPGYDRRLPAPNGTRFGGFTGVSTHPDATDVVLRFSFAEWVIAKRPADGAGWKQIGSMVFWHSITWLTRNASNQWVLSRAQSRIARGSLSAAVINSAP